MERSRRLLLVAGLLAALLPAAAAAFGPQPGAPCEPTLLATQVALFCAPDMPTAQCCEPVVAAVDLGGGVPCLCRVAAEPQLVMAGLNATHLLTLYGSCGGLRPGGAHLTAACEGPARPPTIVSSPASPPQSPPPRRMQPRNLIADPCNLFLLARPLVRTCAIVDRNPPKGCCVNVVKIVERDCLC
ncbi:non-specific lipid-transfer protein EPAD1-like [Triticum aestivum]|uniref:non-specific lipid-transfer protein EPAD1-like n=1 Tax=Triticum aestivum TaxID=4565 RepID=UPI000842562B|nr:non-specific lipid-transfer protein EPAD1-like [Triticum aestivum]